MKSKIKFITAILILISCHAVAQRGHSINSNSIIHQVPRMNGAMHANASANANAMSHANSNSIFGIFHHQPKHNDQKSENVKEAAEKDQPSNDNDESNDKTKKSGKK